MCEISIICIIAQFSESIRAVYYTAVGRTGVLNFNTFILHSYGTSLLDHFVIIISGIFGYNHILTGGLHLKNELVTQYLISKKRNSVKAMFYGDIGIVDL